MTIYCLWLGFHGRGGYETVIDSYIWEPERGVRRSASLVPAGLSGTVTRSEEVCWFPDSGTYWVLIHGTLSGASGRALLGTASVFQIGPESVKLVWSAQPEIGNVNAHAHGLPYPRWELDYVDMRRFYADLPNATFLDIYDVIWDKRTYRRFLHRSLD